MNSRILSIFTLLLAILASCTSGQNSWIRINQVGYFPDGNKTAVLVSKHELTPEKFEVKDVSGAVVYSSNTIKSTGKWGPFESTFRLDFSDFKETGDYLIEVGNISSPIVHISDTVYAVAADFLLNYMRQQRCGYNPYLQDSCHLQDGYTMYGPMPDSTHIDVTGGWHDATDYLQYATTSANAVSTMLLAYRDYPQAFSDSHQANGLEGKNDIPDVVDEAIWGLEWLEKMHPREDWLFNQIADDRDHVGFRLPTLDSASYGKGLERPVYFSSGEIQGLFDYKNRATGVASIAGKFAAAFGIASTLELPVSPVQNESYRSKAYSAYQMGIDKPGTQQTAPGRSPYFYEEDTWKDDMELGAAALWLMSKEDRFMTEANDFARAEPIVPWMGADTATHYQYYPFVNMGHYLMASGSDSIQMEAYYREAIERVASRGADSPFLNGIPFIWCSNNLTAAFLTQCLMYREMTGDNQFLELEGAMLDWLLGCNPWGISMIVGYPENGNFPKDTHSSLNLLYGYRTDGSLVDGPVYGSIFNNLRGLVLEQEDEYAHFQSDLVVYHDDVGDYSTNEPTMDGTATLIYYFAYLSAKNRETWDKN